MLIVYNILQNDATIILFSKLIAMAKVKNVDYMKHALDTTGFLWARCELTELGA
jgi:hypothetical protein